MLPSQHPWVVVDDAPTRFLDTWMKLARKLLDYRYLQSIWSELGNFLKHIKAIKVARLRALRAETSEKGR